MNTEHITTDVLLDDPAIISINKNLDETQLRIAPQVNKVSNDELLDDPVIIRIGTNLVEIPFRIEPKVDSRYNICFTKHPKTCFVRSLNFSTENGHKRQEG